MPFQKSITHAVMVALCGLGIVLCGAISQAMTNYHPTDLVSQMVQQSISPILIAACAGAIHFLTIKEGDKS